MALPPALAAEAIHQGWAEVHPVARLGLIPPTLVMIYAPRDEESATSWSAWCAPRTRMPAGMCTGHRETI